MVTKRYAAASKRPDPTEVLENSPKISKDTETDVKFDVTTFNDSALVDESFKTDTKSENDKKIDDMKVKEALEIGTELPVVADYEPTEESDSKLSLNDDGESAYVDDDFESFEADKNFRYRPTRVSYKYAANYTLDGKNLRRRPLATYGKWGKDQTKEEEVTSKKSSDECEIDTPAPMKSNSKRKYFLGILLAAIFVVALFVYTTKHGGGEVAKVISRFGGDKFVATVTSQMHKMTALLLSDNKQLKKKTKKKKKKKKTKTTD